MAGVLVSVLRVEARGVNLGVILLIEGEVIDCLQYVSLAQMNQCLDVVNKSLVLDACRLLDLLFDFDGVLVDLGS